MFSNPKLAHYVRRLQEDSATSAPNNFDSVLFELEYRPEFIHQRYNDPYYVRTLRVAHVLAATCETNLPHIIDHHAGNAWYALWAQFNQLRTALYDPKKVCEDIFGLPELLRNRLDAVLEGLRVELDTGGYFEDRFMAWQRQWYDAYNQIYLATPGQHRRRLSMYRQALIENVPPLVEWLEELRNTVCAGGVTGAWSWGDGVRQRVGLPLPGRRH